MAGSNHPDCWFVGAQHRKYDNRVLVTCSLVNLLCRTHMTLRGRVFLARNHTVSMMTYVNVVRVVWESGLVGDITTGQYTVF